MESARPRDGVPKMRHAIRVPLAARSNCDSSAIKRCSVSSMSSPSHAPKTRVPGRTRGPRPDATTHVQRGLGALDDDVDAGPVRIVAVLQGIAENLETLLHRVRILGSPHEVQAPLEAQRHGHGCLPHGPAGDPERRRRNPPSNATRTPLPRGQEACRRRPVSAARTRRMELLSVPNAGHASFGFD